MRHVQALNSELDAALKCSLSAFGDCNLLYFIKAEPAVQTLISCSVPRCPPKTSLDSQVCHLRTQAPVSCASFSVVCSEKLVSLF